MRKLRTGRIEERTKKKWDSRRENIAVVSAFEFMKIFKEKKVSKENSDILKKFLKIVGSSEVKKKQKKMKEFCR